MRSSERCFPSIISFLFRDPTWINDRDQELTLWSVNRRANQCECDGNDEPLKLEQRDLFWTRAAATCQNKTLPAVCSPAVPLPRVGRTTPEAAEERKSSDQSHESHTRIDKTHPSLAQKPLRGTRLDSHPFTINRLERHAHFHGQFPAPRSHGDYRY